jgi:hypothetical protein
MHIEVQWKLALQEKHPTEMPTLLFEVVLVHIGQSTRARKKQAKHLPLAIVHPLLAIPATAEWPR